jgi:hypothetical protein
MDDTQDDYELVIAPITHKVEKDVTRTLTRINLKIDELKRKYGSNLLMTVTLTAQLPRKKLLP